jgi:hypothetical protein
MGGKHPEYRFVKTRDELEDALEEFRASKYRYLHISSHGNAKEFVFYFGSLPFREFADLLRGTLKHRRLFVSACECVNSSFVKLLIPSSECYSIIGPHEKIYFDVAAVVWASYYHLAFRREHISMKRRRIIRWLQKVTSLFRVNLHYYSPSGNGGINRKRLIGRISATLSNMSKTSRGRSH